MDTVKFAATLIAVGAWAFAAQASDKCGKREGLKVTGWGNDWAYVNIDTQLVLSNGRSASSNAGYLSVNTGGLVRTVRICTHETGCMDFGPNQSRLLSLGGKYREIQVNVGWCLR